MDCLAEIDRLFEHVETPEEKNVKLVAYRLKDGASIWWERLQIIRKRKGQGPVQT